MKLLDTDFLLELLLGDPDALVKAEELDSKHGVATTIMNVLELYKSVSRLISQRNQNALDKIDLLLSHIPILPLEKEMFLELSSKTSHTHLQDLPAERLVRSLIVEIANKHGIKTIISKRPWLYKTLSVENF